MADIKEMNTFPALNTHMEMSYDIKTQTKQQTYAYTETHILTYIHT